MVSRLAITLQTASKAQVLHLGERIERGVRQLQVPLRQTTIGVTISLGVVIALAQHEHNFELSLSCADKYLYQAKANGRNRAVVKFNDAQTQGERTALPASHIAVTKTS